MEKVCPVCKEPYLTNVNYAMGGIAMLASPYSALMDHYYYHRLEEVALRQAESTAVKGKLSEEDTKK